ncbi:MAG: flagellar protein export ATPase FliI [Clostridiaceae bacterium]|nr:flagellar protein export ATPase FliI [Clostridiaceae bacterium]
MKPIDLSRFSSKINGINPIEESGTVCQLIGLTVESIGPLACMGDVCQIGTLSADNWIEAEVVGFRDNHILLMPFGSLTGIGPGSRVLATGHCLQVPVGEKLRGRILDGLGRPIDDLGKLELDTYYSTDNLPPNPLTRKRISQPLPLGVRAIDGLLTCGQGQRLGIFAGSGVGKSTLLGMMARNSDVDINVITLVGERGREVREFIEKDLQEEGLSRSVLVVATSDQPAIIRQKSALLGTAIAEYFRDQGYSVLLLMDSLTRFAMAQREIGMAVGEPPVSRGYTPSVFNALPRLLERSGNSDKGSITALYTVLVEGDDMNEPVADTVRGILDGHIVLSRQLAQRNHYPAIDVLASVSRVMPDVTTDDHRSLAGKCKNLLSVYTEARDLIHIGAYKKGSNEEIDEAIRLYPTISRFLQQQVMEKCSFDETVGRLMTLTED